MIEVRKGWEFHCESCPFKAKCGKRGFSMIQSGKCCKVVDFNNMYVTLAVPVAGALVFKIDDMDEDLIPTDKDAVPKSLLDKVRGDETKPDK